MLKKCTVTIILHIEFKKSCFTASSRKFLQVQLFDLPYSINKFLHGPRACKDVSQLKFCDVKTLDSPVKYAEIMSSKDETVMKALGAYIVDCLKLRMHILRKPGGNSD